jgi:hypothetical protein
LEGPWNEKAKPVDVIFVQSSSGSVVRQVKRPVEKEDLLLLGAAAMANEMLSM